MYIRIWSSVSREVRSVAKLRLQKYGGVFLLLQKHSKHPREMVITPKASTSHFRLGGGLTPRARAVVRRRRPLRHPLFIDVDVLFYACCVHIPLLSLCSCEWFVLLSCSCECDLLSFVPGESIDRCMVSLSLFLARARAVARSRRPLRHP